jgi:IS1 family transposase
MKKNLLLWNYWANLNQTLLKWSLGDPRSSLCLYSSNLGTFWLKIEQFWPFEEISIFSNGGHLGYRTALTDTILKGDHLRIISAKFGWDWLSSFREEDFFSFQKVPKFELYKHNDELFNISYRIFYELWTFTDFDWLCKLEKRGDGMKKNLLLWNYWANLNQTLLKWSLGDPLSKLCPSALSCIQDGRHYWK